MAKAEWLLAPWHRGGKAGGAGWGGRGGSILRAGWAARAGGLQVPSRCRARPRVAAASRARGCGGRRPRRPCDSDRVGAVWRRRSCPAFPTLASAALCPLPFHILAAVPSPLGCPCSLTKQEKRRDPPPARASHRPLLRLGLSSAGTDPAQPSGAVPSWQLSLAGGGRRGDRSSVGQPLSWSAGVRAALAAVAPAVADSTSRAPLSWGLAAFPSQATSSHCPSPAECKTSRARGKRCFPGSPPARRGAAASAAQAAHSPGGAASAAPGIHVPPNRPGRAGDVTGGELAGSWPWPPCAQGCPWLRCAAMLCWGAKGWLGLGLAGCRAGFPEALGKARACFFGWEAHESKGCDTRGKPGC